jgi:DNA helicase-2/ATP-dependent DNA helicase PcrA
MVEEDQTLTNATVMENLGIHQSIILEFPELLKNAAQVKAISQISGPVLIIAGPGSGKTFVLVLRTLNILLNELAQPAEIFLCSFTEKSAYELRDRITSYAKKLGYKGELHELNVGTIHGLSNDFVLKNRHYSELGNNYDILDDLTQLLFIFDNFDQIMGEQIDGKFFNKWETKWRAISGVTNYFNRITEELINVVALKTSPDSFIKQIGLSYEKYRQCLREKNKVDFASIQKYFYDMLNLPEIKNKLNIKYVLVDEYQDTNYLQEQLMLRIASKFGNICVVGDEDQSLYRFRGATVRNILEFDKHFPLCKKIVLTTNYRSHKEIIARYNRFINTEIWNSKKTGTQYRYDKKIDPNPDATFPEYPAVFSVWGISPSDEANRLADIVSYLKENNVIQDYSQIALLLHSVRNEHSQEYIKALKARGIKCYCPRQRGYFDNEEIRYMVACFAILLKYYGEYRGDKPAAGALEFLNHYVDNQIVMLGKMFPYPTPLAMELKKSTSEINSLVEKRNLDKRLADYFYQFISVEPFKSFVKDENKGRNLAAFSTLLNIFQNYYHYTVITPKNLPYLRMHFFASFLRFLYDGGINDYEDPDSPIPRNYVQIMTIHQSKGLEFPVVIVGSLTEKLSSPKEIDRVLGPYYNRLPYEPTELITSFDRLRLHYVAFSRAEKMLVLSAHDRPNSYFAPIWQGLPQWPYVRKDLLKSLSFRMKSRFKPKRSLSFTSDLKTYETCPRQYMFFREFKFAPSRSAEVFFGNLVHQTIEEIHRFAIEGKQNLLNENKIRSIFDFNFRQLLNTGMRPIGERQRENAFMHVINYFRQNQDDIKKIVETEVDVSLEKENYILRGRVDLILGKDNQVEVLDFKSMRKPEDNNMLIKSYHKQLCIYAHIIEERYKRKPEKLVIYWTGQTNREDARMVFDYNKDLATTSVVEFDFIAKKILEKDYSIINVPEKKYCYECDFRKYCANEGTLV